MIIPLDKLEKQTITSIIEQFVLTEGTDYGQDEISLQDKVEQVHQQLITGDAFIVYSEQYETVSIVPKEALESDGPSCKCC